MTVNDPKTEMENIGHIQEAMRFAQPKDIPRKKYFETEAIVNYSEGSEELIPGQAYEVCFTNDGITAYIHINGFDNLGFHAEYRPAFQIFKFYKNKGSLLVTGKSQRSGEEYELIITLDEG